MGNLPAGAGDLPQALFHFKKAIAADPDNVDAHYNLAHFALGRILAGRRDVQEAKIHFEKATHSPDPELRKAADAARQSLP